MTKNKIRIIGGKWRSRFIQFPDSCGLRPSQGLIRETLFNWLAPYIQGARCLDLFAGSGALAFEALSRGASQVIAVDHAANVIQALRNNKKILDAEELDIIHGKSPEIISSLSPQTFDVIFLDPPFHQNLVTKTLAALQQYQFVNNDTLIYIETEKDAPIPELEIVRQKHSKQLSYGLYSVR